jgi:DNA-binding MarR family transcriptional regulator
MNSASDVNIPPGQTLAEYLCFAVYSANLSFNRNYKPILDQLGLTYTQYITLVALSERDNQTVTGLGEKLFLESNTLTPMLKKLENMGYVRRTRDSADERHVRVELTDTGRAVRKQAFADSAGLTEACGLTPDEFVLARELMHKVRHSLFQSLGN